MTEQEIIAHIVQGEAGICGVWAMLAVAWVYSRNPTMYGWDAPSLLATTVSMFWQMLPDPTGGAFYLVNDLDLLREDVQSFTLARGPPIAIFECAGGRSLFAFAGP